MLLTGLLAGVELGLNRVLAMDSTALPRLARLSGRVIAVECAAPNLQLFILPSANGMQLAAQWAGDADCHLRAPAASLSVFCVKIECMSKRRGLRFRLLAG